MSQIAQYRGTGKRKTSVARVILRPGDGVTWFNGRTIENYFPRQAHRTSALAPLQIAGAEGTYDIRVRVHGGGPSGQAGAVRHGIARALVEADPELRVRVLIALATVVTNGGEPRTAIALLEEARSLGADLDDRLSPVVFERARDRRLVSAPDRLRHSFGQKRDRAARRS